MKNQCKHLWTLTLISLIWGTTNLSSYADNKNNNERVVKEVVIVSKTKNKAKKERNNEEKEVKPTKPLRKVQREESKFSGEVTFEGAHNVGVSYPARTDFTPSLIITKPVDKEEENVFALDVFVKLGAHKKFVFEDEIFNGMLELKANKTNIKLSQIFLTWNEWTFGITKNNFANIATFPAAKVAQLSWKKNINEMFTVGVGIEEAKEFSFCATNDGGKSDAKKLYLKPRKDLPVGSARVQYNLPNQLGIIELSGLFRPLGWFNINNKKTDLYPGFGVNLGSKINFQPETKILTVNLILGQGIGEYIADVANLDSEPISIYHSVLDGKAKGIMTSGAYASYEHHWTPSVRSTFEGGLTTILSDHKKDNPTSYKVGAYGKGNLVYWFTEHTSVGVEYGAGLRKNAGDNDSKSASQIKAVFEFKI